MKRVSGIDIGFNHTGISVFDIENKKMAYVSSTCVSPKKRKDKDAYVSELDAERIEMAATEIVAYLKSKNVDLVIVELPTGGAQSSRAARALGIATCMSVFIPIMLGVPHIYVTPRDVKLAAAGDPFADKNAIISNMSTMFPDIKKHKKADIEHVADSVATIIAAMGKIND